MGSYAKTNPAGFSLSKERRLRVRDICRHEGSTFKNTLSQMTHSSISALGTHTAGSRNEGGMSQTSRAARMMVVSCERSPHSARKVRVNAWRKMGEMKLYHLACGTVAPDPASTSAVPLASLERCSCEDKQHTQLLKTFESYLSHNHHKGRRHDVKNKSSKSENGRHGRDVHPSGNCQHQHHL